jgi:hypothetical protein
LKGLALYVICFFFLRGFNILSLFSMLVWMIICHGEALFWSSLMSWRFPVHEWATLSQDLEIFLLLFCYIYIQYFRTLWFAPLLLLQCPWFTGLVFSWSHWDLAYSFHSSWVIGLRVLPFFL